VGRLSTYTPELHAEICERLSKGEPLADICRDEHMPAVRTVSDWKAAHPTFAADFAHARDAGFDEIAADCLRIANTPVLGETETSKEWGTEVKKGDMIDHRKLQIDTRLKLLAKWDPKRYGDRLHTEHSGELSVTDLAGRMRNRRPAAGVEDLV
jgi:hypothetical protein